jgi:hypothetical protein
MIYNGSIPEWWFAEFKSLAAGSTTKCTEPLSHLVKKMEIQCCLSRLSQEADTYDGEAMYLYEHIHTYSNVYNILTLCIEDRTALSFSNEDPFKAYIAIYKHHLTHHSEDLTFRGLKYIGVRFDGQ